MKTQIQTIKQAPMTQIQNGCRRVYALEIWILRFGICLGLVRRSFSEGGFWFCYS
jgi:hypothetical protein